MNIFSSIKILDLTRVFSGPFATRHFSDFGAEVIKIEPIQGDDSRHYPPIKGNWSGYFEILNHNKKSLVLDLKNDLDLNTFYMLCKDSDVIVENFTPNIKNKLRIDYETIKKINSKIIYASISGISDRTNKKYYDIIAQAESGLISLNGMSEDMKNATSVVDAFSGMKLAFAISTALYSREITKEGCQLNVSMKGSAFDLLEQNLIATSVSKTNPAKVGNMDNAIAPFGIFKTRDNSIALAIGNDKQWEELSSFLQTQSNIFPTELFLTNSLRLANIDRLVVEIENIFQKYSAAELIDILNQMGISSGKVNKMSDVIDDQENYEEKLLEKVTHPTIGEIVLPTGGIFFSNHKKENYVPAPTLSQKK